METQIAAPTARENSGIETIEGRQTKRCHSFMGKKWTIRQFQIITEIGQFGREIGSPYLPLLNFWLVQNSKIRSKLNRRQILNSLHKGGVIAKVHRKRDLWKLSSPAVKELGIKTSTSIPAMALLCSAKAPTPKREKAKKGKKKKK